MPENKQNKVNPAAIAIPLALAGAAAAYVFAIRPKMLRWGAKDSEVHRYMPGDDIVPNPSVTTDRAMTIAAPASAIWPWLVQMGFGRAGFYIADETDDTIASPRVIIPELQDLAVGDEILISPDAGFTVVSLEPEHALVLRTRLNPFTWTPVSYYDPAPPAYMDASWAFTIVNNVQGGTRLHVRLRADFHPRTLLQVLGAVSLDPIHYFFERSMLEGIKQRAEAATLTAPSSNGQPSFQPA